MPPPISPAPEPPSSVENDNWLGADDCVVSNFDTNAVTGTFTMLPATVNGMPEVLFFVWHAFAVVGNVPAVPFFADVVRPVR
jgi:hypothetical protein